MLSLKDLLKLWGFTEHPFEAYTAEKETRLTDYFVAPPYLDDVLGTASSATPAIVFGSRGIGKSAIRIFTERLCLNGDPKNMLNGTAIAVTYDDFGPALRSGLERIDLTSHLQAILQKMVCAALVRIAQKMEDKEISKETLRQEFPSLDIVTFGRFVARYFTSLSEIQRETAFRGVYDFFKDLNFDKIGWIAKVWASVRIPITDIVNIIQAARGGEMVTASNYEAPTTHAVKLDAEQIAEDFQTFAAMTPHLNLDAWYVLIDKLDEDEHTDGDAAKTAKLVLPILKSLRLLETPHVAFKFFLWDRLRPILVEEKVRLDKVRNFDMHWTEAELRQMIDRRLAAYSNSKVNSLVDIVDESVGSSIYEQIIRHALSSPREIVQVIDAIFREHARHSTEENGSRITLESINRGLDDYSSRRVRDLYPQDVLQQITRLSVKFTSSDFQSVFKKSKAASSVRINRWVDNGYIKRIEDTQSTKDPSKSVYQYEISEPRIRRIIERGLIQPYMSTSLFDNEDEEN